MGQALYRKYRSRSLDEVVGQEPITSTLKNALKQGKISHAYLFTGPRGVGKTSVARILAHEINGLPYDDDSTHLDIIEIDAASNRRIDEIRDLREKVHISPTNAKYKVYIIDEVHMLTKEAFNALLKTLEEPPEHVVFILATTEVHKLPETIISRTQRYSFQPARTDDTVEHLRTIATQEKIKISDDALELIAQHGDGSFRDSVSLLDQARAISDEVTRESAQQLLGIAPQSAIDEVLDSLRGGSIPGILDKLAQLRGSGLQSVSVAKQLSETLRARLLDNASPLPTHQTLHLLEKLLLVTGSVQPDRQLELALLDSALAQTEEVQHPKPKPSAAAPVENIPKTTSPKPTITKKSVSGSFSLDAWPDILSALKARHSTLYGIMRLSEPVFENGSLVLTFSFPFHQKRMNEAANQQKLADIIKDITGDDVAIIAQVSTTQPTKQPKPEEDTTQNLETISNIFGPPEVLD